MITKEDKIEFLKLDLDTLQIVLKEWCPRDVFEEVIEAYKDYKNYMEELELANRQTVISDILIAPYHR